MLARDVAQAALGAPCQPRRSPDAGRVRRRARLSAPAAASPRSRCADLAALAARPSAARTAERRRSPASPTTAPRCGRATSTPPCPGARGTAPSSPPRPRAAGAVAVLTDAAGAGAGRGGRPAAARGRATRARCSATSPPGVYGEPSRRLTGHRHHRHRRQDLDRLPDRVGAAGGRPRHRHDRHRRDPARRRWCIDSVRTTPEATDLHALFAAALERGVDRGGDGGLQPRARPTAGSAGSGSPSAAGPTSAWTTSTSTPTSTTTSRPRRGCSTAGAAAEILNLDDAAVRRLVQAGADHLLRGRGPGGDLARRRRRPRTASASGSPRIGPDGLAVPAGVAPARPAQRGQRAARDRVAGRGRASTRRPRPRAWRGLPGRARPAGAGRGARAGARRRRLRAQAGRDRGGARRAARAGRPGAAG